MCTGASFDPPYTKSSSNCISYEQKCDLSEYGKFSQRIKDKQISIIFFDRNTVNNYDNKIINLNTILCHLMRKYTNIYYEWRILLEKREA